MKDKILLFIPAYNCENQIKRVLLSISSDIANSISEILIVENRGNDSTLAMACQYAREIKYCPVTIIQNDENYSLGGSHKVAFKYCLDNNFEYIIVLHGDDQGKINDIMPIIMSKDYRHYDALLGARFAKDSKLIGYSKFRIYGNLVLNKLLSICAKYEVLDMGSGLNMYSRKVLKDNSFMHFPNDLTFNISLLLHLIKEKYSILFFPLTWREEDQISNAKIFRQSLKIFKLALEFVYNKNCLYKRNDRTLYTWKSIQRNEEQ